MDTFLHGDCLFVISHDVPHGSFDLIYLASPLFTDKMQKGRKKWQPGAMEISSEDQNVLVWESCVIPWLIRRCENDV
jgi:hypothetical protein